MIDIEQYRNSIGVFLQVKSTKHTVSRTVPKRNNFVSRPLLVLGISYVIVVMCSLFLSAQKLNTLNLSFVITEHVN